MKKKHSFQLVFIQHMCIRAQKRLSALIFEKSTFFKKQKHFQIIFLLNLSEYFLQEA